MRLFIHLLLNANIEDHDFLNVTIHRGELATSQASLGNTLKMSIMQIRNSLEHLKLTGEVTVTRHSKFSVISILNYDAYQARQQSKQQANNNQNNNDLTINQQQLKNIKNNKNIKKSAARSLPDGKTRAQGEAGQALVYFPYDTYKNLEEYINAMSEKYGLKDIGCSAYSNENGEMIIPYDDMKKAATAKMDIMDYLKWVAE
jgi:hypothetical protein